MAKTISVEEFDRRFDEGESLEEYMDTSTYRRLGDIRPSIPDLDA